MQASEKWHEASSKLRTHKIKRHSAQCSRPGFVNPSATLLSKHTTALFLALRFTSFCFNVSNQFTPLFYALSFFLGEYHFLFKPILSKTQEGLRTFTKLALHLAC